jgi:protein-S-isoprenylcysteine O-methyltransferase Ste14
MNEKGAVRTTRQGVDWAGVHRRVVQIVVMLLLEMLVLFLSAGRLDWIWAWVLIGLNLVGISINAVFMLRRHPDTVAERGRPGEMRNWDKVIGGLWAVMNFFLVLLLAGLDVRWGWTFRLTLAWHLMGAVVFAQGFVLTSWAMISNAFFSTVVRIQEDRGHTVYNGGPYRVVRHPGYVGAILQSLATPILLGSLWALIPGGVAALLMGARTALEDRMLHKELAGYPEYARQVKYRLLPGVW